MIRGAITINLSLGGMVAIQLPLLTMATSPTDRRFGRGFPTSHSRLQWIPNTSFEYSSLSIQEIYEQTSRTCSQNWKGVLLLGFSCRKCSLLFEIRVATDRFQSESSSRVSAFLPKIVFFRISVRRPSWKSSRVQWCSLI